MKFVLLVMIYQAAAALTPEEAPKVPPMIVASYAVPGFGDQKQCEVAGRVISMQAQPGRASVVYSCGPMDTPPVGKLEVLPKAKPGVYITDHLFNNVPKKRG